MKVFYSVNTPGAYYVTEGENIDEELKFAECLKPLKDADETSFVMLHSSEFRSCPEYPGVSSFWGEYRPPKKEVNHDREIKHLTFTLGDLIKEALK